MSVLLGNSGIQVQGSGDYIGFMGGSLIGRLQNEKLPSCVCTAGQVPMRCALRLFHADVFFPSSRKETPH